jgi:hypothetical protein
MTSQPDKLFRESLENLQKNPSAAAWDRIEDELDSSSKKGMWYKIAASIALVAVATFILWPSNTFNSEELSHNISSIDQSGSNTHSPEQQKENTKIENQVPITAAQQHRTSKKKSITKSDIQNQIAKITEQELIVNESLVAVTTTTPIDKSDEAITQAEPSVTLVYTANEMNTRFLKKNITPEATSDITKSSTIQKLIDVAYTIKNSEGSLGDLRLKKDEILALNFRESKQKQN